MAAKSVVIAEFGYMETVKRERDAASPVFSISSVGIFYT
jgi:hypothetical protein